MIWTKEVIEIVNLGDVTKIKGSEAPLVDIITYGAPCQDISVAGRRAGMKNTIMGDDESTRSGLFFDAIRIVKEQRNESLKQLSNTGAVVDIRHIQPRYTIYENVCGAFSSNSGEDFRAVLEETCKVADENAYVPGLAKGQKWASAGCIMGDGYSVAWRVHDAQFWGVPQRRKRICVLADYGGHTAPEILFELLGEADDPESYKIVTDIREQSRPEVQTFGKGLSGNTEQGKQEGQGTPRNVEDSLGTASTSGGGIKTYDVRISSEGTKNQRAHCYETDRSRALDTGGENPDSNHGGVAIVGCDLYNQTITGETAATLNASSGNSPTHSGVYEADTSRTLDLNGGSPACNQGGMAVVTISKQMGVGTDDKAETLMGTEYKEPQVVAYGLDRASFNQGQNAKFGFSVDEELAPSLVAKGPGGVFTGG